MPTKIIMPQLGESVVEGTISKWLKNEGDSVDEMESLLEVNTDKVDSEIPSPAAGTLLKILVPEGETVNAGTVIAWIGQPGEAIPGGGAAPDESAPQEPAEPAPEVSDPGAAKSAQAIEETVTSPIQADLVGKSGNGPDSGTAASPVTAGRSREIGFISPIVARLAQEHEVDLFKVTGTGEGGRITKKDVLAYIEERAAAQTPAAAGSGEDESTGAAAAEAALAEVAPWETPADGDLFRPTEMVFSKGKPESAKAGAGPTEAERTMPSPAPAPTEIPAEGQVLPHSTMRRRIAEHMVFSKRTSPHVTTVMEADLHRVIAHYNANKEAFRRDGARLTYTSYFVAAAVQALRDFPVVNSSWTEEGILIHPRINLGVAVSLGDEGLIVPVIRNAETLSLLGLSKSVADLAARARGRKLAPEEVRDGTFTITNHGISGSLFATPVINQPQCGILGVGAIQKRVVVIEDPAGGDSIAIRPMVYLSLTFDHRILDGASGDGFLARVVEYLENWK